MNFHHESILPAVPRGKERAVSDTAEACRTGFVGTLHMANKAGAEITEDSFR